MIDFEDHHVYILLIENVAYVIVFHLLFGGHIARHFRYSCAYVFSRLKNRKAWFLKRVLELLTYAAIYDFLYVGCILLVSMNAASQMPDRFLVLRAVLILFFSFLLLAITVLIVNLLSLRLGTASGLFVTESVIMGLIGLLTVTYRYPLLVYLNPVAFLNLFDQGGGSALFSCIYDLLILIGIILIGIHYLSQLDIALFDPELN